MDNLKIAHLNATFYLSFLLFSALFIPLFTLSIAIMSLVLSYRRTMRRFRRANSWYGWIIIRILVYPCVRIEYKDYAPDENRRACVFVCNHRSASDAFLLACLPYELVQVVNIWPFRIPVLGICARSAGYLSINEMPFEEFLRRALLLLSQGVSIAAFPEGTRSGDKSIGQFHSSIFRVALKARCPVVPVSIAGNENIPPRGSFLLHPGLIKIRKLPALEWDKYKEMSPFKLKNHVRDIISRETVLMDSE